MISTQTRCQNCKSEPYAWAQKDELLLSNTYLLLNIKLSNNREQQVHLYTILWKTTWLPNKLTMLVPFYPAKSSNLSSSGEIFICSKCQTSWTKILIQYHYLYAPWKTDPPAWNLTQQIIRPLDPPHRRVSSRIHLWYHLPYHSEAFGLIAYWIGLLMA